MADKIVDFTWRHDQHQVTGPPGEPGIMNVKAGDTTKLPESQAIRHQLFGDGTIGKVLKPHVHDQDAIDRLLAEDRAKYDASMPHLRPRPGSEAIHTPRQRVSNGGWSG